MRALITGGAGFLGTMLAQRLLRDGLSLAGNAHGAVDEVILVDLFPPHASIADDPRVRAVTADVETALPAVGDADVVFHLAGIVSSAAEHDFDLGMRTNIDATRQVLEWCRAQADSPVLVFTSSLAVYGADPLFGPVDEVTDQTLPRPQSSYGIQKFIGEQLVTDYARKGFVRGRSVRLMTVAVRPGRPNAAASSFLSSMIREPLAGETAVCPVPPDMPVALSSPRSTIDGILRAAETPDDAWRSPTAMNLPALTTTPRAMAAALDEVTGTDTSSLISWQEAPDIIAIVGSWPARFISERAETLGLTADASFSDVIRAFLADA